MELRLLEAEHLAHRDLLPIAEVRSLLSPVRVADICKAHRLCAGEDRTTTVDCAACTPLVARGQTARVKDVPEFVNHDSFDHDARGRTREQLVRSATHARATQIRD